MHQKTARAKYEQECVRCSEPIRAGMGIVTWGRAWVHTSCDSPSSAPPRAGRPWVRHIKRTQAARPASRPKQSRSENAAPRAASDSSLANIERDLECARELARAGMPIFVGTPLTKNHPRRTGPKPRYFREPDRWQTTEPDPAVVDRWEPGMLLAAVTGVLLDVVDTDPRDGGAASRESIAAYMPAALAVAATPRGGFHELIPRTHVAKRSGTAAPLPGLDLLAGDDWGNGRAYIRLAPTVMPYGTYAWVTRPVLNGSPDEAAGRSLAAHLGIS